MVKSKITAMAKILLWQVLAGGEGSMEQWWRDQRPEVKEQWRKIATNVLYHYESTQL